MAGVFEVFEQPVLTIDGADIDLGGSLRESTKGEGATVASNSSNVVRRRVVVPAASKVTVWEWADTEGFAYMEVRPVRPPGGAAEGFIHVGMRYNAPTSETDLTPTGSIDQWITLGKSCTAAFKLDSERAYIHATPANAVGEGAGTYPGVWDEGAKVLGVCDAIAFYNPDADEEAVFDLIVVPK